MQDPVRDIAGVIHGLTTSLTPEKQLYAVQTYFTPDAAFEHPLCAIAPMSPSYGLAGSQDLILGIYRWYKVLFTRVELQVKNVTYNNELSKLYVDIQQSLTYRILPQPHRTVTVNFVTVITLQKGRYPSKVHMRDNTSSTELERVDDDGDDLWFIKKQEDLYQTEEWASFLLPGLRTVIHLVKYGAGLGCAVGALGGKYLGIWG